MRAALLSATVASALLAAPVLAADAGQRVITVLGVGTADSTPDVATITVDVRGEGKTAQAATRDLVDKQAAITRGLEQLSNAETDLKTGTVSVKPARGPACDEDEFDDKVRMTSGPCATTGYVAQISLTFRTSAVRDAGTIVGLASQLGAKTAEIASFDLKDANAARARALEAAVANGRAQAEAIAAASKGSVGRLIRVESTEAQRGDLAEITVTGRRRTAAPAEVQIVPVVVAPHPITTRAELVMTFEIAP